jgi:hypothetical protein
MTSLASSVMKFSKGDFFIGKVQNHDCLLFQTTENNPMLIIAEFYQYFNNSKLEIDKENYKLTQVINNVNKTLVEIYNVVSCHFTPMLTVEINMFNSNDAEFVKLKLMQNSTLVDDSINL